MRIQNYDFVGETMLRGPSIAGGRKLIIARLQLGILYVVFSSDTVVSLTELRVYQLTAHTIGVCHRSTLDVEERKLMLRTDLGAPRTSFETAKVTSSESASEHPD